MTIANEILMTARNASSGIDAAEKLATQTAQDWANEATLYSFEDGSTLVASGPQLNAYRGRVYPQYTVSADASTGEWVGDAEFVGYVDVEEWNGKSDGEESHYDTYEEDGETRAVEVVWIK